MKRLRVLLLVHADLVPPEDMAGYDDAEVMRWKTEYDVAVTLREMGHRVEVLGLYDDLAPLHEALRRFRPQVVMNLLEEFHGSALYDYGVVAYLELCKLRYTGCNPRGLLLSHDKALAKKLLAHHHIATPRFKVYPRGRPVRPPSGLRYPLIVKSLVEDGSYGIARASVVHGPDRLVERGALSARAPRDAGDRRGIRRGPGNLRGGPGQPPAAGAAAAWSWTSAPCPAGTGGASPPRG
ncbi:MAG: hypothetical protein KatS3mg121_0729 [Gammaproteobacteria bacterium]|nr:MAG: hypothetical protein KatS3mg121_0729 [Gammaproteobacteria bacterium]